MPAERHNRQILDCKDRLRGMIARAELPEGAPIDEEQLRREVGATVRATRQALKDLALEGLIVRKRHVGTFVSGRLPAASASTVLPKVRSVGILSSCRQRFFTESVFGSTLMLGVQLALQPPAQITYYLHAENRSMSIDDLPWVDSDAVKRACQGLLAIEAYDATRLNELARSGLPLVSVDFAPLNMAFDAVEVDHFAAGYLAARHLLSLGHRRIGFVGEGAVAQATDPTWQARLNGYTRALMEAGLDAQAAGIADMGRSVERIEAALTVVQRTFKPTAYVLCSGGSAGEVRRVLGDLGLSVPGEVSLAAADSAQYALDDLTLSQARVDYEQLGRNAVRMLASRLACKAMPPLRYLQAVTFAPGQSSRPFTS